MCVDYTDLNRVCPKDAYPLPNIDKLVDIPPAINFYASWMPILVTTRFLWLKKINRKQLS
jgi:hypothetical protein